MILEKDLRILIMTVKTKKLSLKSTTNNTMKKTISSVDKEMLIT